MGRLVTTLAVELGSAAASRATPPGAGDRWWGRLWWAHGSKRAGAGGEPPRFRRSGRKPEPSAPFSHAFPSLLLGSLIYRIVATAAPVSVHVVHYGFDQTRTIVMVAVDLILLNLAGVLFLRRRLPMSPTRTRWLLAGDLIVAMAANLIASVWVPGPAAGPYHDVFWFYLVSCIVLITGAGGVVAGLATVVACLPLEWAMDRLGPTPVTDTSVMLGRTIWLGVGVMMAVVVLSLVGVNTRQAMLRGIRSGQEAERARILRSMHDTVLQALEVMALDSTMDATAPGATLAQLRRLARSEAMQLRHALDELIEEHRSRLGDELAVVARSAAEWGLRVELVVGELDGEGLTQERREALRDAVREALGNIAKHSGVTTAVVRVETVARGVQVTVRDHGTGFEAVESTYGFGIRESIFGRMREADGEATIESCPGRGTRIRLWVPV